MTGADPERAVLRQAVSFSERFELMGQLSELIRRQGWTQTRPPSGWV